MQNVSYNDIVIIISTVVLYIDIPLVFIQQPPLLEPTGLVKVVYKHINKQKHLPTTTAETAERKNFTSGEAINKTFTALK